MNTYGNYDWCQHYDVRVVPEDWMINGEIVPEEDYRYLVRVIGKRISGCPYCGTALSPAEISSDVGGLEEYLLRNEEGDGRLLEHSLKVCVKCGFWNARCNKGRGSVGLVERSYAAAVKRIFPIDAPKPAINELKEYLRRKPHLMTDIDATVFERLVGDIFKDTWGDVEVIHVGKTNDGGVDLVLIVADNVRWLVQCKRRQSLKATEGVRTVRELLGSLVTEGELKGIVVSTANHFSFEARKLAGNPNLVDTGYEIELCDFGVLKEMMAGSTPGSDIDEPSTGKTVVVSAEGPWASFFTNPWNHTAEDM